MSSHLSSFSLGDKLYKHVIFIDEDDRVELQDGRGTTVLTYTADCVVYDKDKSLLGMFSMDGRGRWLFQGRGKHSQPYTFTHDLLEAEVEVSKMYLNGELK